MEKELIGKVVHYYNRIEVAIVELTSELKEGDRISIEGPKTKVEQIVDSIQIEQETVKAAHKGDSVGLKVIEAVRKGNLVYKLG